MTESAAAPPPAGREAPPGPAESAAPPRSRLSAGERREQLVDIALRHFARTGYFGTVTEPITREAGISHAYLFRLFGTKKDLFLACARRTQARTLETFRTAAAGWTQTPESPTVLSAMGKAYVQMLADRELLQMQMQVWAACSDPDIRAAARASYRECFEEIERLSGAGPEDLRAFIAKGMLLNVAAAMSLGDIGGDEPWVTRLLDFGADEEGSS